ncbi:MAG: hypothetical protein Q8P67_27905 [archaeon]|nr:hypothetical protein [archaeon]
MISLRERRPSRKSVFPPPSPIAHQFPRPAPTSTLPPVHFGKMIRSLPWMAHPIGPPR